MSQTIEDVVKSARELSFDRFVTPTFYVSEKEAGESITITTTALTITKAAVTQLTITFSEYPTLEDVINKLITEQYPISYSASYISTEPSNSLLPLSATVLSTPVSVYRRVFFSNSEVLEVLRRYFVMLLGYSYEDAYDIELTTTFEALGISNAQPHHMALWIAYWLVDRRRVYEMAAETMGQSTYMFSGMSGVGEGGVSINTSLADVFSITDEPMERYNEGELAHGVGADNVLGDAASFWYRLQLWLRSQFERLFGDFALRADTVVVGQFDLQKDQNFYAFYDQYPYTISPLSREILSSFSP